MKNNDKNPPETGALHMCEESMSKLKTKEKRQEEKQEGATICGGTI